MWLIIAIAALICDAVPAPLYVVLACTGLFATVVHLVQAIRAEKRVDRTSHVVCAVLVSVLAFLHLKAAGF